MHKRVDENFLNNRVEPRLVVIIAENVDLKRYKPSQDQQWEPKHYTNVTINLNKYIAKYDYDIGQVLYASNAKRSDSDEALFRKSAVYEIM